MKGVAVVLLLLLVLAASGFAQAPDDKLIVPAADDTALRRWCPLTGQARLGSEARLNGTMTNQVSNSVAR